MPLAILGLGTAVPAAAVDRQVGQLVAEAISHATQEQATFIPAIYAGSGIERRYFCLGQAALDGGDAVGLFLRRWGGVAPGTARFFAL